MTIEEIRNLDKEAIEVRMAEIKNEMEAEDSDLEALNAELDAIEERKTAVKAEAEARALEVQAVLESRNTVEEIEPKENIMETRTFEINSVEYREAWLKNLMGRELDAEERAAMTATNAIPTETENLIVNRLKENALLSKIDLLQIPGYVDIPVYGTNGDAAWGSTNEQADVIDKVSLTPFQLIKTVELPGTVDAMSISAFEAYLTEALANKIESALQYSVIAGTGSSQPQGINAVKTKADGTFTKAGITKADLMKIMGSLDAKYQKDAVWIMPNALFYEAMAVCDVPGFVALNAELQPIIGGKPVVIDDAIADTIFFGGAKAYHMNIGKGVEVAKDASVGFKSNSVNYRAVCLADGKLDSASAFVKFTRATA